MEFNDAVKASPCPIDGINNSMACEFLRGSVSVELKRLLDQDLPFGSSASWMLWMIIQKVQGCW